MDSGPLSPGRCVNHPGQRIAFYIIVDGGIAEISAMIANRRDQIQRATNEALDANPDYRP